METVCIFDTTQIPAPDLAACIELDEALKSGHLPSAAFMWQLFHHLNYLFVTFPVLKEQQGDLVCCFCEWYLKLLFITLTRFTL